MATVSIIGAGVVGTATGKGFHKQGHDVIFYDISRKRMAELKKEGYNTGSSIEDVISQTNISFVCVPTPTSDGRQDISHLMKAVADISNSLENTEKHHLLVFRSTMLPGTMNNSIIKYFHANCSRKRGQDYDVCYNPEFLRQSFAFQDFEKPDRVVIGEDMMDSSSP